MSAIVNALLDTTNGLTADKLLGVIAQLVPFIVMIVPISLAVYFLRKLVKGAGKAKVRF